MHPTVNSIRRELEAKGEINRVERTIGKDEKERPSELVKITSSTAEPELPPPPWKDKVYADLKSPVLKRALDRPNNPWNWYEVCKALDLRRVRELKEVIGKDLFSQFPAIKEGLEEYRLSPWARGRKREPREAGEERAVPLLSIKEAIQRYWK